jgi:2-amino-4-hydroxy-6-hydroxymethyldihydropteridine diphosphokinase
VIFVGIGSNLAAPGYSSPQNTAEAALAALPGIGAVLCARSSWYASEPVPASDQPWFINAVVEIGTELSAPELLAHPRLHERRFVLLPLQEIAPQWRHPRLGLTAAELLARLPPAQAIRPLTDSTEKSR